MRLATYLYSTDGQGLTSGAPASARGFSGWMQWLAMSWLNPLLRKGYREPLENDHLFALPAMHRARRWARVFFRSWRQEQRQSSQKEASPPPRLWAVLYKLLGFRMGLYVAPHSQVKLPLTKTLHPPHPSLHAASVVVHCLPSEQQ